jgi:hypothetical protein
MAKDKFGLRDITKDKRDLQLGALYFLPRLEDLPDSFDLKPPFPVKDQGNTDYCSAYSSCGVSELQEIVELYPEYSFALSKEISGDPDAWGQNMRDAMKAHQKYGGLPLEDVPEGVKSLSNESLRDFNVFSFELKEKAFKQRKKSYFTTKGQYDAFDNIRASIWQFRNEKQGVIIGVGFSWSLSQYILDTIGQGYGHAMYLTGWDKDGLIAVNSYGESAGKNGKHRITREVINEFVGKYGAYMMLDIDPDEVKRQLTSKPCYVTIWEQIKLWISSI